MSDRITARAGNPLREMLLVAGLFVLFAALTLPVFITTESRDVRVRDGQVTLPRTLLAERPALLHGEWAIERLGTSGGDAGTGSRARAIAPVPGGWEGVRLSDGSTLGHSATMIYRLSLRDVPAGDYRLFVPPIWGASNVFVDGRLRSAHGEVGHTAARSRYKLRAHDIGFTTEGGDVRIGIAISTFHDINNGMRAAPVVGTAAAMDQWLALVWARTFYVGVAFVIIGLFALIVYFNRPVDRSALFLALGAFALLGIQGITGVQNLLLVAVPRLSHEAVIAFLYVFTFPGIMAWAAYVDALFPDRAWRGRHRLLQAIVGICGMIALTTLAIGGTLPASQEIFLFLGCLALTFVFVFARTIAALRERRDGAILLFIGQVAIVIATGLQASVNFAFIAPGPIARVDFAGYGLLVYAFTHLVILARRWTVSIVSAEALNAYNERILSSMSSGVITLQEGGRRARLNDAAARILGVGKEAAEAADARIFIADANPWLAEEIAQVAEGDASRTFLDHELMTVSKGAISANLSLVPLRDGDRATGVLMMIDDISASKRLEGTIRRFMTQDVMDQVLAHDVDALFGSACRASVLFADIRGFTTMAEALSPRETVELLNELFSEMYEAVAASDGVLDKFMGDAIMAVYGAPLSSGRDALNAVTSAVAMLRGLDTINLGRAARGTAPVRIGIGVSTGEVVAGTIGSPKRMDYTVIGDSVNLAARLQELTKAYRVELLVCENTAAAAAAHGIAMREIDVIRVRGRTQPAKVFEVQARPSAQAGAQLALFQAYCEGREQLVAQEWDRAIAAFERALEIDPDDGPANVMLERASSLADQPPGRGWDGVWQGPAKAAA